MKGIYQGQKDVAIKVFFKDLWEEVKNKPHKVDAFMKEFNLISATPHTNIVRVHGFILHNGYLGMVMEFAAGGNLRDLISDPDFRTNPGL